MSGEFLVAMDMLNQEVPDATATEEGLSSMFYLFEHLANGGTVENYEALTKEEACFILALAWRSSRLLPIIAAGFPEQDS